MKADMKEYAKELGVIKDILLETSESLNENPYLNHSATFRKDMNVLLDEISRIKKQTGKRWNEIKHILREN